VKLAYLAKILSAANLSIARPCNSVVIRTARQLATSAGGLESKLIVLEQLLNIVLAFMLSMKGYFTDHEWLIRLYQQSYQAHSKQPCKGAGGQCTSRKRE